MTFLRRIQLDLGLPFWAWLALWATASWCDLRGDGDLPWSVESAFLLGCSICGTWWLWSDAVRRGYCLLPAWGLYLVLVPQVALLVYLFRTRGWWALLTLALYLGAVIVAAVGIAVLGR
ncbi:MAG TPA: hypothetical protein PLA50_02850 [Bacteroidia bacterium]|nr:hypothetical protein [Bacteroidia bacterium]